MMNAERQRIYRKRHPEECKAFAAKWKREHPEACRAYDAKWKMEHPEEVAGQKARYRERHPEKVVARNAVNHAIRDGRLSHGPCEVCGAAGSVHAHHDDYDKPLDVRWLCYEHHQSLHQEES